MSTTYTSHHTPNCPNEQTLICQSRSVSPSKSLMFRYEQASQTTLSREALELTSIFLNSYSVFCEFEPEMRNFVFASSFSRQHSDCPASNLVKIFERNVEDVCTSNTAAFSSGIRQTRPICSLNLTACSSAVLFPLPKLRQQFLSG